MVDYAVNMHDKALEIFFKQHIVTRYWKSYLIDLLQGKFDKFQHDALPELHKQTQQVGWVEPLRKKKH